MNAIYQEAIAEDASSGIWGIASSAETNARATVGPLNQANAAEWLECWTNDVRGMMCERDCHPFITDADIEWFAARGVKA